MRPHSTTPTPRRDAREEFARVGRKDVDVSGESVSVSWNAAYSLHGLNEAIIDSRLSPSPLCAADDGYLLSKNLVEISAVVFGSYAIVTPLRNTHVAP